MTALRMTAAGLALALAGAPLAAQAPPTIPVDTTGVGALIDQGMTKSQVMQTLQYLSDIIGPRLTGSPAVRQANDGTLRKFQEYGLDGHLEPWNFGGTWERGAMWLRMTAPRAHDVVAASWAWAPGTNGKVVRGPVVRIDASSAESLEANKAKVKGAFVMLRAPSFVWNNDGPPMSAADTQRMRDQGDGAPGPGRDRGAPPRRVGLGNGRHRQRHRLDGHARGRAHHCAVGPQAEAHHPLHPVHGGGAGAHRLAQVRRGPRGGGGLDPGRDRARQWRRRDHRTGPAGPAGPLRPVAGDSPAGAPLRRRYRDRRLQGRHRSPVVPAVRRARVQLQSDHARLQPHPPLPVRYLGQSDPGGPDAGVDGDGRVGVGAGEPAGDDPARRQAAPGPAPDGRARVAGVAGDSSVVGRRSSVIGLRVLPMTDDREPITSLQAGRPNPVASCASLTRSSLPAATHLAAGLGTAPRRCRRGRARTPPR